MKNLILVSFLFLSVLSPKNGLSQIRIDSVIKVTNIESSYPYWSPDGGHLVFQSNRMDNDSEIYTMRTDGGGIKRLTFNPGLDEYPSYSPDNNRIVFVSQQDGNQEIYAMDTDGDNQVNLTQHPSRDIHPVFSPTGDRILFNSNRNGNFDLFTIDIATGALTQLTDAPEADTYAHWSPDGSKIVFVRWLEVEQTNNHLGEIFILDLETSAELRLTNNTAFDGWPSWSADGNSIIFASNRSNQNYHQMYVMNTDGSNPTKVTHGELEEASYTKPIYAKDGSNRIVCTRTKDGNVEIFIFSLEGE